MEDSAHFLEMLRERGLRRAWVDRTLREPELTEDHADGTRHFARRVSEFGERWLRVVVNVDVEPQLRVTAFFDRRLRERHESQGGQED